MGQEMGGACDRGDLSPSGKGGGAENPGPVRSGRPRGGLAALVGAAACRPPAPPPARDPIRAGIPSGSRIHGAVEARAAPSPPRIVRISRLSRSANENQLRSEFNVCRPFRAAKPRANGRCVAGCEATRHCKAASPAHTATAPHPASLRRLRAPRAPTPATPRRSPLPGGPGRQRTALVRRRSRGGASARPPTRDGGRTRRGPRASGVATAGGCGAGCGASARRAGQRRRGNEPPDGPHRAASAPAARPRPKAKAALPRGPRRGRPTARLRSRSEAEPSERDREAGSRGRKTVPEYGGKANARRVADGIAMTTRPKRESPREAEEARETAATRCARATPDSGTASQEPTPPSAAGAPAHAPPPDS